MVFDGVIYVVDGDDVEFSPAATAAKKRTPNPPKPV